MQSVSALKVFVLFLSFRGSCCDDDYSYDCDCIDPDHWASLYPDCRYEQSPIALDKTRAKRREMPSYKFITPGNNGSYLVNITNNGHTAVVRLVLEEGRDPPYLEGYQLTYYSDYVFDHIKFSWGPDNDAGSEHTVKGKRHPLELQAMFYRRDYGSYSCAMESNDDLVGISRLYRFEERENPGLEMLMPTLQLVEEAGASAVSTNRVYLDQLIRRYLYSYFWYAGTLTYPPCYNYVLWIIDDYTGVVSNKELNIFRRLKDSSGRPVRNVRPLQPLGYRPVYFV